MSIDGSGNGGSKHMTPLDTMPKVVTEITISLHQGGQVSGQLPTDMKVAMYMLGEFLKQIGPMLEYKPASPIVAPPAGLLIKGGK